MHVGYDNISMQSILITTCTCNVNDPDLFHNQLQSNESNMGPQPKQSKKKKGVTV